MNAIYVVKSGMLTTIQDLGRWGHQSHGVPVAGPMDPCSHRMANALVGNDASAATLEITMVGPELEFGDERLVAVAGAEFDLTLDGRPVPNRTPFLVSAQSHLLFGPRQRGARAYLAVSGGILPSPTALVVLLAAIATHRVAYGLALILAFSLGLATALIVVAMGALRARTFVSRRLGSRAAGVLAILSALVIVGFGLFFVARGVAQI